MRCIFTRNWEQTRLVALISAFAVGALAFTSLVLPRRPDLRTIEIPVAHEILGRGVHVEVRWEGKFV